MKGLEYFIKAAELLLKKYKNLKFIFTGAEISSQKKYQKKIQNLLLSINNKKIINFGMCSNVRNLLKKTDIFVCTSLSEAGPITLYEAISMNIPVVTTKVGAVEQILKNNYSAIMVKKSDTNRLQKV